MQFTSDYGFETVDSLLMETPEPTETTKDYRHDANVDTRFDKEFATLNNWNELLLQKMVLIQKDVEQQMNIFHSLERKANTFLETIKNLKDYTRIENPPEQITDMLKRHEQMLDKIITNQYDFQTLLKGINLEKHTQALEKIILDELHKMKHNLIPKADQLKFYHEIRQCCSKIGEKCF